MSRIIVILPPVPQATPGAAPAQWPLSEAQAEDCVLLSHALPLPPSGATVLAPPDRPATQAAAIVALRLGLPTRAEPRLREVDYPPQTAVLVADTARYLRREPLPGWEPLAAVATRLNAVLTQSSPVLAIAVTHPLALAAWLSTLRGRTPFAIHQTFTAPTALSIDPATGALQPLFPAITPR